jgi:hypothetical protein
MPLYDAKTGGCRDGLMADGINQNEGAESSLAWLLALMTLQKLYADETLNQPSSQKTELTKGSIMHIAMLSPIAWRTPPRHYGPWENVASLLTEGLVHAVMMSPCLPPLIRRPAPRCMPFARRAMKKTAHSYPKSGSACTFQNSLSMPMHTISSITTLTICH